MARTKERKQEMQVATRDYTLNMHKRLQGIAFKKRATRSVRDIKRFAAREMHTQVSTVVASYSPFRTSVSTPNSTATCGPEASETCPDWLESESAERRTRTRMPLSPSTATCNFSKSSLSPASRLRISDQSSSCFKPSCCELFIMINN